MLGNFGHIAIVLALVTIALSSYAYFMSIYDSSLAHRDQWKKIGRISFLVHGLSVLGVISCLFLIIFLGKYEYHYAWSHASSDLPIHYIISCFWEGQEGSFLLWIFWNTIVGTILIWTSKKWETSVMAIFALVQVFLVSMILGVHIPALNTSLGSSPFILLRDALDAPIFLENPSFVPLDGNGLNPLLQNYWMVIHPPIIFLGFSLSAIPFCYALAGLMTARFNDWISFSAPWLAATVLIMGTGIMMGAYWAYETLNFGGYWSWDPVENAIYIPWLVLVAALHGAVLCAKGKFAQRHTLVLTLAGFVLVLYATFLTRSGILGNASVHSFTDLGLSGQLLVYLLFFLLLSIGMTIKSWDKLAADDEKKHVLDYDFWMLLGIVMICLAAFQVLIPTSIPVYNSLLATVGIDSNAAPPSNPVQFYSKFQLWFAIGFGITVGIGQVLYVGGIKNLKTLEEKLFLPLTLTFLLAGLTILLFGVTDITYILALISSFYGLIASIFMITTYRFKQVKSWGGALSHAGMAVVIMGIVFSAGHSKIISTNQSLEFAEGELDTPIIRENILIERNKPSAIDDYSIHFDGVTYEDVNGQLLAKDNLINTNIPSLKIYNAALTTNKKHTGTYQKGDTILIKEENAYFNFTFIGKQGQHFTVSPRIQNNAKMGMIASPSIKKFANKDIYLHVTNYSDEQKKQWSPFQEFSLMPGDSIFIDDFLVYLSSGIREEKQPILPADITAESFALTADLYVSDGISSEKLNPLFLVSKDRRVRLYPDQSNAFGTKMLIKKIEPKTGQVTIAVARTQPDWVTIKAIEMPMINLVWIGTIVMILGMSLSVVKRVSAVETSSGEEGVFKRLIPEKIILKTA